MWVSYRKESYLEFDNKLLLRIQYGYAGLHLEMYNRNKNVIQVGCIGWDSLCLEFVAPNFVKRGKNYGKCWNSQHTSLWTYKSSLLAKAQLPSFLQGSRRIRKTISHVFFSFFAKFPLTFHFSNLGHPDLAGGIVALAFVCISKTPRGTWNQFDKTPTSDSPSLKTPLQMLVAASPENATKKYERGILWSLKMLKTSHKKGENMVKTSKLNWWVFFSLAMSMFPIMYRKKNHQYPGCQGWKNWKMGYHGRMDIAQLNQRSTICPAILCCGWPLGGLAIFLGSKTIASR